MMLTASFSNKCHVSVDKRRIVFGQKNQSLLKQILTQLDTRISNPRSALNQQIIKVYIYIYPSLRSLRASGALTCIPVAGGRDRALRERERPSLAAGGEKEPVPPVMGGKARLPCAPKGRWRISQKATNHVRAQPEALSKTKGTSLEKP
jgi:hypothetical protein